jgi:hypothetical protein
MAQSAYPQPGRNIAEAQRYLRPGAAALPEVRPERWATTLRSLSVGVFFFLMGALFDIILQRYGIGAPAILWGDLLAGVVAGLLVLFYERRRRRELQRRMEMICLMNHHVRNSLQLISYAATSGDREEHLAKVRGAIERIDWALREVLPGKQ